MQNALRNEAQADFNLPCKRIRVFLQEIYRHDAMASRVSKYVSAVNGVRLASANPLTGKILVIFDEAVTDEYSICSQIYEFVKNIHKTQDSKIVEMVSLRKIREPKALAEANRAGMFRHTAHADNGSPFHGLHKNEIIRLLRTDPVRGLSTKGAQESIKSCGYNLLSEKKKESIFKKIIKNLFDFSTRLLLAVGTISLVIGQIPDAIAIFGIVAIQTVLSTVQQHKAENSISSLKGMMVSKAKVIRDGKERVIAAKYLVPGDIILVEGGDKVPVDARIVECHEIRAMEASLTGESSAVDKCAKGVRNRDLADQANMLFMGTDILCGRAKAIVTSTGMHTEIGKIANMLQNIKGSMPPIQKKVNRLTKTMTIAASCFCLFFAGAGLLTGKKLGEVLIMSICFSIGAIPESLPAVVSASMALSVQRMAKKNAIVRCLPAVETLGSTDVICCDKTGTLTMNEMTVKQIYTGKSFYFVKGSGYNPEGEIILKNSDRPAEDALERLLTAAVLCNNASLVKSDGKWSVNGDPTEGALLTAAYKQGLPVDAIKCNANRVREIPFDSTRQCMMTVNEGEKGLIAYCKGAFGKVSEKCSHIYENGQVRLFTAADKENLRNVCKKMGDNALRVLTFAYKEADGKESDLDSDFVFLGIVGMADPARPGVIESIQKCHHAGINVVMITGDNKNTAAEIARQVGLLTDGQILTGTELDGISDDELHPVIDNIQVFARTCPEHKHRIVKALKSTGHIVAMIGDGVNDTPAMKEADIGVAMGKGGSDVAKDVAGITLVDDDFSTIVAAIQEGRSVTNNIQNATGYLLAGAFGEIAAIGLCALGFGVLPLISIQILWVNVIAETIIGSVLAAEPPCCDVMDRPPYEKGAPLLDRESMRQIFTGGMLIGLSTLGIFGGAMLLGLGLAKARTLAFSTLIISQLIYAYQCRRNRNQRPSKYMRTAMLSSSALLLGILYCPSLGSFFGTVPLTPVNAGAVCLTSNLNRIGTR